MKKKVKYLNLYADLGGNRKLLKDVQVTAIEKNPKIAAIYKSLFPDDIVIVTDAHQYLLEHFKEFDFVWSSPPCQTHSRLNYAMKNSLTRYVEMSLYQEIILLRHYFKGSWIVENVIPFYKQLIDANFILDRHSIWANFDIPNFEIKKIDNFSNASSQALKDWLGIQYPGNVYYNGNHSTSQVLRNCIHPKLGEHIFNSFLKKYYEPTNS